MAAHPQIAVEDAKKMIEYVLSLGEQKRKRNFLVRNRYTGNETDGAYILARRILTRGPIRFRHFLRTVNCVAQWNAWSKSGR
jgi:hypothetical protein